MSTKIMIEEVEWIDEKLCLKSSSVMDVSSLSPTGRMLADSDQLAFIYILETAADYVYVSISKEFWPELKKALSKHSIGSLVINNQEIVLEGMEEELQYLINNIKGNANYGDEMVKEVEGAFL